MACRLIDGCQERWEGSTFTIICINFVCKSFCARNFCVTIFIHIKCTPYITSPVVIHFLVVIQQVITVVSWVSAHGRSTINPHFHHTGCLPCVLGAYSVQQLKEVGSIIMGVALAKYAHVHTCTLYIEHVCMIFRPSTRATRKEQSYA